MRQELQFLGAPGALGLDQRSLPAPRVDPRSRCDTWWPPRPRTGDGSAQQRHLAGRPAAAERPGRGEVQDPRGPVPRSP